MFLVPVPKGPACLTNVFHCTFWVVTITSVYNTSFVVILSLSLVATNRCADVIVAPKDKHNITNEGSVTYRYKCHHPGCTVEYIGETGRTFEDR